MMLTITYALLTWIVVLHWRLAESRSMQLRLADRIYRAHCVLANLAERRRS